MPQRGNTLDAQGSGPGAGTGPGAARLQKDSEPREPPESYSEGPELSTTTVFDVNLESEYGEQEASSPLQANLLT